MLADKGIDPGAVALPYQECIHRLPSGRQLVQYGNVQISIHQQRQSSGNGGCGHDQQMGIGTLGGQLGPLAHAEAVLFIGDHQSQVMEHGAVRQQGVGPHRQIDFAGSKLLPNQPLFLGGHGAGEQRHPDAHWLKNLAEGLKMLLRQDFRGGHQCALLAVLGGAVSRRGGYHSLAAAHVALDQPVHGAAFAEIRQNFLHRPPLGSRQGKRQGRIERSHVIV